MGRYIVRMSVVSALLATLFTGCGDIDNTGDNIVGENSIVGITPLFDHNATVMQQVLASMGITDRVAFGVKGYKIDYITTDDSGESVTVSGLINVPVPTAAIMAANPSYSMSIVSDQHGTIFPDTESPTTAASLTGYPGSVATLFSVIGGFVTIQPDYIGFGTTKGTAHPYLLEESSANTVVDMIEAAIAFGNGNGLPLNGQVFLTGYSEGGYVTMAAAKKIEADYAGEIALKGVAPMAGPYDLTTVGMGVLGYDQMARPDFIGGIVNAYANAYADVVLEDIVQDDYETILPTLYNGDNNASYIQSQLTYDVASFFEADYRTDFLTNQNNTLRLAFAENSLLDWSPTADMQLYYCSGDTVIPGAISQLASQALQVEAIDVNASLDHAECAIPAYQTVLQWFDSLRSGE